MDTDMDFGDAHAVFAQEAAAIAQQVPQAPLDADRKMLCVLRPSCPHRD